VPGAQVGQTPRMDVADRRAHELRLAPDRALVDLDQAAAWVGERGMVTITPDSALPSLFAACHEEPYAEGSRGFGNWPATKYTWPFELSRHEGVHALRIHRGRRLLVSDAVAEVVDPLARAALAEAEDSPLVAHLAAAGPSLVDELREELGLDAGGLRRLRGPLERTGALLSRSVVVPAANGGHRHTSELRRWDQVFPQAPTAPGGIEELLVAGVRAAVAAPEAEVGRWFSWPLPRGALDRLVDEGRLAREGELVVAGTARHT
jgi:hypothetical protein